MNAVGADAPASAGRRLPDGFYLGCRHVGLSDRGAGSEDGKGASIWDTYAHTPGNIKNDATGDVANDHDHPTFTDEDLKIIGSPLDFVGINVYRPISYVLASDQGGGWREIPFAKAHPTMFNSWLTVSPEVTYWAPKLVQSLWNAKEIHITENGCASDDVVTPEGKVYDTDRIMFLRACLTQLQRATAEGVPVKGYFHWSTMDNFEWINGFGDRFGLVRVDFKTQERSPKLSASLFRECAALNGVA